MSTSRSKNNWLRPWHMLRATLRTALLIITATGLGACAVNNTSSDDGVNDLMLKGFDPVSYFSGDKPVRGSAQYQKHYEYGTYFFANDQNLQQFSTDPQKYVPQYGGFCSKGVSYAIRAGGDPLAYAIHNDRLFIFANEYAKDYWSLDPTDMVGKADGYWESELRGRSVKWTNMKRFVFRVPHYKTYPEEFSDYEKRSGKKAPGSTK